MKILTTEIHGKARIKGKRFHHKEHEAHEGKVTKMQENEGGTVIKVQAVYDEQRLKQMAENTATVNYGVLEQWKKRPDFLMDMKALAMGFLEALSERDDARASCSLMNRDLDHMCEVLTPLFQNGRPYNNFARLGETLVDAVPRLVTAYESQSAELKAVKAERDDRKAKVESQLVTISQQADDLVALHVELGAARQQTETVEEMRCPTCKGSGEVHSHNPTCWECRGRGAIKVIPFADPTYDQVEAMARKQHDVVLNSYPDAGWGDGGFDDLPPKTKTIRLVMARAAFDFMHAAPPTESAVSILVSGYTFHGSAEAIDWLGHQNFGPTPAAVNPNVHEDTIWIKYKDGAGKLRLCDHFGCCSVLCDDEDGREASIFLSAADAARVSLWLASYAGAHGKN